MNLNLAAAGNSDLEKVLRSLLEQSGMFLGGNVYFVMASTDPGYVDLTNKYQKTYSDGTQLIQTDLEDTNALLTTNRNDVVVLAGNSTFTLSASLAVTKSRVHFVGMDYLLGIKRRYGQSSKVSLTATTGATNIATVINTGVRNTFRGIKFLNASTVTQGIYCFADGGEYTFLEFCEIYKSTDLDQTGAAELVANGDSSHYKDCYIGSTVDAISGSIIRPCVTFSRGLAATGAVARDVTFENCIFARKCGDTANRFVYGAEANAVERLCLFENCKFWNAVLATATPAQNVGFGATLTDGSVLLNNCVAMKGATAMSTTTGVFVNGATMGAVGDTVGIAIQAS